MPGSSLATLAVDAHPPRELKRPGRQRMSSPCADRLEHGANLLLEL